MSRHEPQWMMPEHANSYMRFIDEGREWVDESAEATGVTDVQSERRAFRRFNVEPWGVCVRQPDDHPDGHVVLGRVLDLSAGGVRLRTDRTDLHPGQQIKVRLELPIDGGLCPFVDVADGQARPKREWVGWLEVARVRSNANGTFEVGGRLVDMEAMDRGMLGLYLSAQRMAA